VWSVCNNEADVVFILDASGSLDEPNFDHVKNFVSNLTSELDVDSGRIQIGVVTYSDRAEPRFNLNEYNTRYATIRYHKLENCRRSRTEDRPTAVSSLLTPTLILTLTLVLV